MDGREVAVKIQKPALKKQIYWDFVFYKMIVKGLEILFDLPMYWSVEYTEKQIRKELDFCNEGKNSERASKDLEGEKNLYIPKVLWDITSTRILTTGILLIFLTLSTLN